MLLVQPKTMSQLVLEANETNPKHELQQALLLHISHIHHTTGLRFHAHGKYGMASALR
jgi:hypothetical protein